LPERTVEALPGSERDGTFIGLVTVLEQVQGHASSIGGGARPRYRGDP
jgi:hypothetical protein